MLVLKCFIFVWSLAVACADGDFQQYNRRIIVDNDEVSTAPSVDSMVLDTNYQSVIVHKDNAKDSSGNNVSAYSVSNFQQFLPQPGSSNSAGDFPKENFPYHEDNSGHEGLFSGYKTSSIDRQSFPKDDSRISQETQQPENKPDNRLKHERRSRYKIKTEKPGKTLSEVQNETPFENEANVELVKNSAWTQVAPNIEISSSIGDSLPKRDEYRYDKSEEKPRKMHKKRKNVKIPSSVSMQQNALYVATNFPADKFNDFSRNNFPRRKNIPDSPFDHNNVMRHSNKFGFHDAITLDKEIHPKESDNENVYESAIFSKGNADRFKDIDEENSDYFGDISKTNSEFFKGFSGPSDFFKKPSEDLHKSSQDRKNSDYFGDSSKTNSEFSNEFSGPSDFYRNPSDDLYKSSQNHDQNINSISYEPDRQSYQYYRQSPDYKVLPPFTLKPEGLSTPYNTNDKDNFVHNPYMPHLGYFPKGYVRNIEFDFGGTEKKIVPAIVIPLSQEMMSHIEFPNSPYLIVGENYRPPNYFPTHHSPHSISHTIDYAQIVNGSPYKPNFNSIHTNHADINRHRGKIEEKKIPLSYMNEYNRVPHVPTGVSSGVHTYHVPKPSYHHVQISTETPKYHSQSGPGRHQQVRSQVASAKVDIKQKVNVQNARGDGGYENDYSNRRVSSHYSTQNREINEKQVYTYDY